MTYVRLTLVAVSLLAAFLLGVWLTQPAFPVDRKFVAMSLNGDSLLKDGARLAPTFTATRHSTISFGAAGSSGCNQWAADLVLTGTRWIALRKVHSTAVVCPGKMEIEEKFARALPNVTRWRREGGILILENDTDVLRFLLAPR